MLVLAFSVVLAIGCSSEEDPASAQNPGSGGQGSGGATGAGGRFVTIVPPDADCGIINYTLTQIIAAGGDANGDPCLFAIGATPPDPSNVRVMTDDRVVPPSDTDGWRYLPPGYETIQFTGSYCDAVLLGTLLNPHILFGCASVPIP